jgi:YD repeat-containing protein
VPSDGDDRIINFTYNGNYDILTITADLSAGQNDQTTTYTYGVTIAADSDIASNNLLASVTYPTDGNPATSETETFTYNALGQSTSKTDRNGSKHVYAYDALNRLTSDTVQTLGTGVNGAVRRLGFTYNSQGLPDRFTSYSDTAGATVFNKVLRHYNGLGQLIREYQDHTGAVTGGEPSVQYSYSFAPSGTTNHSRLTAMTYPNGRQLYYNYGTTNSLNDRISRLDALVDNNQSTKLESFCYLDLGTAGCTTSSAGAASIRFFQRLTHRLVRDRIGELSRPHWQSAFHQVQRPAQRARWPGGGVDGDRLATGGRGKCDPG